MATTMKAARISAYGTPAVLEEIEVPTPGDDEVLVKVRAASVNPIDWVVASGFVAFMTSVPMTLGGDFSGEVVDVGKDVTHIKPGDEVFGYIYFRNGSFAEYVVAKANEVALKPASIDHSTAAAVPLPALAAWQTLFDHGAFQDGDKVLIHGVGGALGTMAAQIAKSRGAYVYGTDFADKKEHALGMKVDRFIDTETEKFEDVVDGVAIVLDYVGGDLLARSYSVLGAGGRYVTTTSIDPPQDEPASRGFKSVGIGTFPRTEQLAAVADLIDSGKVRIAVKRRFPLSEAQAAMDYRYADKAPGKVIIAVD